MSNKTPTLFIIAGEASGDSHGAHLVRAIKQTHNVDFFAMGSKQLAHAGAQLILDSTELAVVGFTEILSKLNLIRKAFKKIKQAIAAQKPALIILIDYPGFNLRLVRCIKKLSPKTKIIYYISPQIWAWRYNRIHIIKQHIDLMAVIFPFEVPIYQNENVPVKFVGHPLSDHVKTTLLPSEQRSFFGLRENSKVIGLMPGSRQSEIAYLLPTVIKAAELLAQQCSDVEFLLPLAPNYTAERLKPFIKSSLNIKFVQQKNYDAIATCDALIVASGTATLEIALLNKPMVIIYKGSPVSFALAKRLVKIEYAGLCNIIAGEMIVKELLQNEATPENIAQEIILILQNQTYREAMISRLRSISAKLKQPGMTENLSDIIVNLIPNE